MNLSGIAKALETINIYPDKIHDVPQFNLLTYKQALCGVHDGRNYKKVHPVVPVHREKLEEFLGIYWDYYRKLPEFKEISTPGRLKHYLLNLMRCFPQKPGIHLWTIGSQRPWIRSQSS